MLTEGILLSALLSQQAAAGTNYGWLVAGLACLLLLLAGILFGRTPLDWRMDRYNERVPWSGGCDNDDSDETGMYEGQGSSLGSCMAGLSEHPALAGCGSGLCALAGYILSFSAAHMLGLENFSLWWLLVPIGAGYVIGRVTDRGPVGPLE